MLPGRPAELSQLQHPWIALSNISLHRTLSSSDVTARSFVTDTLRATSIAHLVDTRSLPHPIAVADGTGLAGNLTKLTGECAKLCVLRPLAGIVTPRRSRRGLLGCMKTVLQGRCEVLADALEGRLDEALCTLHKWRAFRCHHTV